MIDLKAIKDPKFLKSLSVKELEKLALEIRSILIENISKTGGHLASNLGVIELTIALHYVFDSPLDSILFDVSHQIYTHKILTGRADSFSSLRQHKGISGYANYKESEHDKWESGHAGTVISAMVGHLYAKEQLNKDGYVVGVVGDASITNGTNMEALNFLGQDPGKKGIIILNDNNMSISKSVGGFSIFLSRLRGSKFTNGLRKFLDKITPGFIWRFYRRIQRGIKALLQTGNMFEDMGYAYIGPINGNNIKRFITTLKLAKKMRKNVVIHAITQKGKGYEFAEIDVEGAYHGVPAFDKDHGLIANGSENAISWSQGIANIIDKLMDTENIFVVMPAMTIGSGFLEFQKKYPNKIVDVGIAEEHAAVMSAALALNKINVFLPIYSTFSQRAYDQILNDIARPNLKVVIGIDRAGFVGEDGSTHQGLYDVSMFLSMPNITVTMPKDLNEAQGLLKYAYQQEGPFVIRYPRGSTNKDLTEKIEPIKPSWEQLSTKNKGYLISYGAYLFTLLKIIEEEELDFSVINARYLNPIDEVMLAEIFKTDKPILVYEETHASGSLYAKILDFMVKNDFHNKIRNLSVTNKIINHGTIEDNRNDANIARSDIVKALKEL